MRNRTEYILYCTECKKQFTTLDKPSQRFCSRNCVNKNKTGKSMIKKTKSCTANNAKVSRLGKNNPAYRNGTRAKGKSYSNKHLRNNRRYRLDFLEKHGYIFCEHCGTNDSLRFEVHHLIFASEAPKHEHLHNPINQIMLCIQCHNDFHSYKPKRKQLVKDRNLGELFNDINKIL